MADGQAKSFEMADQILAELGRQMHFLRKATEEGLPPLSERMPELAFIAGRLQQMFGVVDGWLARVVRGYVMLSLEFLKLQRQLERTGRYLLQNEREALEVVYTNAGVFGDYYLPGLLLSEALWPNHYQLGVVFRQNFLPRLPASAAVLEIGVGTGYHLAHLLDARPDVSYLGLDISAYAVDFCRRFALASEGSDDRVRFVVGNASAGLPLPAASADAVVMGEILEHIDNPAALLREVRRVLRPGGCAFMTTVAFAANIDHVYLFESVAGIRTLLSDCAWNIVAEWPLPVYPGDEPEMLRRPINYGAVLKPSRS